MEKTFEGHSAELANALGNLGEFHAQVSQVVDLLKQAFANGNKVLIAGNGGSAAEAVHFSDEMVGKYRAQRPAYPVISLTADGAIMTCIANDYGYDEVFARQVDGLGKPGDIFIGLTTSGTSANILEAAKRAKANGMITVAMTGPVGEFKDMADVAIVSPSTKAAVMQELHLHAIHLICEMFEPEQSKEKTYDRVQSQGAVK